MGNNVINCTGLSCPIPVVNTKKYLDSIESGSCITIVDNEIAKNNVVKLASNSGFGFKVEEKESMFYITIDKNCDIKAKKNDYNKEIKDDAPFTIVIASKELGDGSDELGAALMKSYLFALSEADVIPENLLFLNGGVKLVVEDSPAIESLKKLEKRGTKILSCGLCLDFYHLKDKIAIGEITNMYAIVEIMNSSRTIKL